jgi:peptidoglycan/LPS O-acetylase OafA/YrhL
MPLLRERRLPGVWLLGATIAVVLILGLLGSKASYQLPLPKQPVWAVWGTVEAFMWGVVVICYSCWRGCLPKFPASLLSKIGEVSYSFYLLHGIVLFLFAHFTLPIFEKLNWRVGMMLLMLTLLPLCFAVARLSYEVIERPWLQMRGRYHGKFNSRSVPASVSQ